MSKETEKEVLDAESIEENETESCETEAAETVDVDEEVDFDVEALEIEKKDKEIAELSDKLKRLAAEYDNFRKRTSKEKLDIYKNAVVDVVEKFLPVIDNLERAKEVVESDENKAVVDGVMMVFNQVQTTLEALGVEEVDCSDEFDPNCHNAVMHIEDDSYGENVVAEVLQKGYTVGDRVIRCAMVKVAN